MMARFACLLLILATLAAPTAAAPFHHPYGEWREYNRDWLAACPDVIDEDATDYYGFSCFASTGSPELNDAGLPAYKLTLIRNRLTGALDLSIVVAPSAGEIDPTRPLMLTFSGEPPIALGFETDLETRYNVTNQYFLVDDARDAALLDRLKARTAVRLSVPLKGEPTSKAVQLSLRGVAASIDFMATYARRVAQY